MCKDNWYTFTEASKLLGKNRNYFFNRYRSTPSYFKSSTVKVICGVKFINDEGVEYLKNSIKKMVVHLNS